MQTVIRTDRDDLHPPDVVHERPPESVDDDLAALWLDIGDGD